MGSTMRKLPVNVTDRERLLFCIDNTVQNVELSEHLVGEPFERATPIRDFCAWPGKRNYEGMWWSSTICAHVPFESLLEREYLLSADFDPHVVGLAAQPLAILWPRGTPHSTSHTPISSSGSMTAAAASSMCATPTVSQHRRSNQRSRSGCATRSVGNMNNSPGSPERSRQICAGWQATATIGTPRTHGCVTR